MTRKEVLSPVVSSLEATGEFVDNAISDSLKQLNFGSILAKGGLKKTQGASASSILNVILATPLVKKNSTWAFCKDFLEHWRVGCKDVIYRFLTRQDIKWAVIQMSLAAAFCRKNLSDTDPDQCALVVDCSKKHRFGKVEGSSQLYDPTISDTVRAQLVIALGLATPKGFVPLANQFSIGKKKRQERSADFEDGRNEVAKAYHDGIEQTASQILARMVKRAKRAGIKANWLIGDSGYGLKANIALAIDHGMDALFLMKRDSTTYRVGGKLYKAKQLHGMLRRKMAPAADGRFRSYAFKAEINLHKRREEPRWVPVQLMLSRPAHNRNEHGWVLSLCTNMEASTDRMIELYLMRWSIEVFFKECKQHLGWLTNQSGNFVTSYASMHLSSIRYQLLLNAALGGSSGGLVDMRRATEDRLSRLCYMGQLWEWFTLLVFGWLDELKNRLGVALLKEIKAHLEAKVDEFIELAFQFDLNSPEPEPTP